MESPLSSVQALVTEVKKNMYRNPKSATNIYSFISVSAYDTAWLSMIPDTEDPKHPMFQNCLEWVLNNQNDEGFWGEYSNGGDGTHRPTIDSLPATLACLVALKTRNVGKDHIRKGLAFVRENMEILLKENNNINCLPRWFNIVFPGTVQLAQQAGLELNFSDELTSFVSEISLQRQQILDKELELVDKFHHPPILAYLETFPSTYEIDKETIVKHLSEDGSLFQSPSATARAFMITGNQKCLNYLKSLARISSGGVPPIYPMDEELVNLSVVDQVQKLGLSEYFTKEIQTILTKVHRSYTRNKNSEPKTISFANLYKDSLAFRLLRLHGYDIHPRSFCWFLYQDELLEHLEQYSGQHMTLLYNIYRATDLMFSGETELDEARSFSRILLEKNSSVTNQTTDNLVVYPNLFKAVEEELRTPWIARLDHLDHRMWIEQNKESPLWVGKASFYRLSCVHNENLMKLAVESYKLRQLVYRNELEELKRWSKRWGLTDMGFGREKTTYCYYAAAASTSLPYNSVVRTLLAKNAILVTVADDFFDMKGSLDELRVLMEAIRRWDGERLNGPSKIIFDALNGLVNETTLRYLDREGCDITENLRDMWRETFESMLTEATWAKTGSLPTVDEYLETGMISIGTHTFVLPSSCFLNPSLPKDKIKPHKHETITRALMATCRLLNDIRSHEKEQEEGKVNLVLRHFKENPGASIEESIAYVNKIIDERRKELLEHSLRNGQSDLPKPCKLLHLSCLKVFQMLFTSSNRYDSDTGLLQDINKAIYVPPEYQVLPDLRKKKLSFTSFTEKICLPTSNARFDPQRTYQHHEMNHKCFTGQQFPRGKMSMDAVRNVFYLPILSKMCFV